MKFYLSSYHLGKDTKALRELFTNSKVGYVPNALDVPGWDQERIKNTVKKEMGEMRRAGLEPELLDLKEYFGDGERLRVKIDTLGGLWINGGNTFVLLQAMQLSGLDQILKEERNDFVYAGFSAAGCVLAPRLECLQIVDEPIVAYEGVDEVPFKGLGLIDFTFMPHYKSNHPESAAVDKEIALCEEKGVPYKAVRDGEVLIFEK